jgi:uncharacterized protein (DUF4415 family)
LSPKWGRGRLRIDNPKVQVTLRLGSELLDYFGAKGASTLAVV